MKNLRNALILSLVATLGACGSGSEGAGASGDDGAGVGQGGAQDFGQFRGILDAGGIPGPETLDDVGFFNEHKFELPAPDCGTDVCLHGQLGVMGNMITGSNCTVVMLGMNTPVDPEDEDRPPLNLAIAVDVSGSMSGESISYVREGLFRMLDDLEPDDRVSIVTFSDKAETRAEAVAGNDPGLVLAIESVAAGGMTNIYDGLRTAYDVVDRNAEEGRQNRVILLSDGQATSGITSDSRLTAMSASYNEIGYGLTTIGMGDEFDPELMRELAESGSGTFYFLEDPQAVEEVFEEEVRTFLVPLAEDVTIDLTIDPGYSLRAMYGTKLFTLGGNVGRIEIPTLQVAHRTDVDDIGGGRRGGGGAIVAELLPLSEDQVEEHGTVGRIEINYRVPGTQQMVSEVAKIETPLAVGEAPDEGYFEGGGAEKAFVMLNIFAGFDMAASRAAYGDDRGALGVLEPLRDSVSEWLDDNEDADIEDDLRYIEKFISNLEARGASAPPPEKHPPEPWPRD